MSGKTGRKLPTKVCPKCGVRKAKTRRNFSGYRSKASGVWIFRICKKCQRAYKQQYMARVNADPVKAERYRRQQRESYARRHAADPERFNAWSRTYRQRVRRTNPERAFATYVLPQRFRMEKRRLQRARERYVEPPVGARTPPYVDTAPLTTWLRRHFDGWEACEIARVVNVDGTYMRRLMAGEYATVSLHIADRIFVAAGCPHLLALLYPLEDDERQAA